MRAAATLVAGVVLWALALECRADVPVAIFSCTDRDALAKVCGRVPDIVVCINDFQYQPPVITPRQGDMVAWVNVEKCADPSGGPVNVVEDLVANKIGIGCDTHHEVITFPEEENIDPQDNLDARICSPNRGIPALLSRVQERQPPALHVHDQPGPHGRATRRDPRAAGAGATGAGAAAAMRG